MNAKSITAVLAVALLAGCEPQSHRSTMATDDQSPGGGTHAESAVDGSEVATGGMYRCVSSDNSFIVQFRSRPDPIPLNAPFEMTVEVLDEDGQPARGDIGLVVDATMPAHRHGMNTIPITSLEGKSRYQVTGMLFHMPGHWELHFDVTRDGVTERARYDVELD